MREPNYRRDEEGCLVIRARLQAEAGAVVLEALEAATDAQRAEEEDAARDDVTAVTSAGENRFARRRADAIATIAETTLRHGGEGLSSAERYPVVVHFTAETLAGNDEQTNRVRPEVPHSLQATK